MALRRVDPNRQRGPVARAWPAVATTRLARFVSLATDVFPGDERDRRDAARAGRRIPVVVLEPSEC